MIQLQTDMRHPAATDLPNTGSVIMFEFWVIVGLLLATVSLTIVIILLLSNLGAYFTKIAQGTVVFINTGDSLRSIWPNVSGYRTAQAKDLEDQQRPIPEDADAQRE